MSESRFALALDAGMTCVKAVTHGDGAHGGVQGRRLALMREGFVMPTAAFITDDGDVRFGDEAVECGAARPERLVRDLTREVGDGTPLVVGGFAVTAAELFARMVAWIVERAASEAGALPGAVAVVHPTSWSAHRIDAVRRRLHEMALDDVTFVPAAVAAAGAQDRTGITAVYDLGAQTLEASALRGRRLIDEPLVAPLGGIDLDAAVRAHVDALVPGSAHGAEVAAAKEELSFRSDAALSVDVAGRHERLRLTRAEFETLTSDVVARTVGALEAMLERAALEPEDVTEITLIGGSARLPLAAQMLSERLDRPLRLPEDPQFAAALGAAELTWERMPATSVPVPVEPARIEADQQRTARPARRWHLRIPYGVAATLAAAAVVIAAGVVFSSATPLGGSDAAEGASHDDTSGAAELNLVRRADGYSSGALSPQPDGQQAAQPDAPGARSGEDAPPRTPRGGGPAIAAPDSDTAEAGGSATTTPDAVPSAPPVRAADAPTDPAPADQGPEPTPDPTPDPTPIPEPDPTPDPTQEPTPEPTTAPTAEPASGPEPSPEPQPTTPPSATEPTPDPPEPEPTAPAAPSSTEATAS